MTSRYSDTLLDQKLHPIAGALLGVTTLAGDTAVLTDAVGATKANPFVIGADGGFEYYAAAGLYQHDFYVGGRKIFTDRYVQVGALPPLPASILASFSTTGGAALVGSDDGSSGSLWTTIAGFITYLKSSAGSAFVGFKNTGTGAAVRTVQDKLGEITSDGDYTTGLTAALTGVRNTNDASFSGAVRAVNGLTDITAAIAPPQSFARITGGGGKTYRAQTAINIFDLSGASHSNSSFQGFRTYGGVNVVNAATAGEIASNRYRDLILSTFSGDAWFFTAGLTSCSFNNCIADSATGKRGIYSGGGINNDNTVSNTTFTNLTDSNIKFLGTTNGLYISNVRVEGNGQTGVAVFDFISASGVRIGTGWYEGHHETLLKLTTSPDGAVVIDGIIDVGAKNGAGFKASLFNVGSSLVVFGTNTWSNLTTAPLNCLVYGLNDKLSFHASNVWEWKTNRGGKVHLKPRDRSVAGASFDLFTVSRPLIAPNDFTNQQMITGTLRVSFTGADASAVPRQISRTYPIQIYAVGGGNVTISTPPASATQLAVENAGAITLTPQLKASSTSATSATLEIATAGVHATLNSLINVTFEFDSSTNLSTNTFTVTPA